MRKHSSRRNPEVGNKLHKQLEYWISERILKTVLCSSYDQKDREFKVMMTFFNFISFQCSIGSTVHTRNIGSKLARDDALCGNVKQLERLGTDRRTSFSLLLRWKDKARVWGGEIQSSRHTDGYIIKNKMADIRHKASHFETSVFLSTNASLTG